MSFWSMKPRASTFESRLGENHRRIKRLIEEIDMEGPSVHSMNDVQLRNFEAKLTTIDDIYLAHLIDVRQEIDREPDLLETFPTIHKMFDRHIESAGYHHRIVQDAMGHRGTAGTIRAI